MRAQLSNPFRLFTVAAVFATSIVLIPAPPALAAGSPDIDLVKEMPARALAGDPAIPVTLTASNPDATTGYNLSFKDVLPPGVSLATGNPAPTTILNDAPIADYTTLLWENLADLPPGSAHSVSYTFTHDGTYDVGDTITNDASAYVNSNPRFIPKFDPTGVPSDYTGNDADSKTTLLVPFLLDKTEPSAEAELLRGLHDHQTPYTLEVSNNFLADSTNLKIDDWIPAGMEYLICGGDDYSAGEEYPGSGAINAPGNAPSLANPCIRPTTVDTVTLDPDGTGPLPSALYTHVLWDIAELGITLTPGQVWRMDYVAAIPMNANAAFGAPPAPASLQQAANIDNNTGPTTQETLSELGIQNYALLTGDYTGDNLEYTDDAYEQVDAEDVSIHKGVNNTTIGQGNIDTWTLLIESSEYVASASGIVVTDTVPDGLCPLGAGTVEGTAECDFGGEPEPSHPYALAAESTDGTWTLRWDFDVTGGLGPMGRSESRTITFPTKVREYYQENGVDTTPVVAEDEWTNLVDLAATADGRAVEDESSAGQSASSVSILKEVADQPLVSGPSPFACGDGAGLTWDSALGTDYGPGDRACWRLTVTFPANLDTAGATITDFIPVGHGYTGTDSWAAGANTTVGIILSADLSQAASGILRWDIGDGGGFTEVGQVAEIVFSTTLAAPNDGFDGDLKQNLMKFSHTNSPGAVFPLRDQADAVWAEPEVDLVKGVYEVVRGVTTIEGPNDANPDVDGVTVIENDRVTFRLTIDNTGSRDATDVEVIDTLPPGITCGDVVVASITAPGACVGDRIEWLGATAVDVAAGGSVVLEYDIDIPLGVSPGLNLVNTAGVRSYSSPTNQNTDFVYFPAGNIDPAVTENTAAADDTSSIVTDRVGLTKTRTTEITEPGNDGLAEATIGEEITYTITAVVPEGLTVYGPAVLSDSLAPELELVSATITSWDGVPAQEPILTVDLGADTVVATYGGPHINPVGGPAPGDDTLVVEVIARVADVAANTAGTAVSNAAAFDYETQAATPLQETIAVSTTVVEPDIGISKDENDPDDAVQPGQLFTYTLTVDNAAGQSVAHDIVVSDNVPEGLTPSNISDGGIYIPDGVPGNGVAGTITWGITSIDPDSTVTRTYDATVDDPVVGSSVLINTATAVASGIAGATTDERDAGSPNAGTPPSRYEETTTHTVFAPSLQIDKSVSGTPATIGDPVQYTLTVTVPAQVIFYDATVIDSLPAGIAFDGTASVGCIDGAANPCSPDIVPVQIGSESAWYLGDLSPSSSETRIVTIVYDGHVLNTVNDGDTETNSASVYGNTIDRILVEPPATTPAPGTFDVSAGPASADVDIIEPNLTMDKDVVGQAGDSDTRRALPNETLTYQLTISNTGSVPAHDVVITDVVDTRVIANSIVDGTDNGVAWTVTDADPSDGDLGWFVLGPIPAGTSFTIAYDIDVWAATVADEVVAGPEFANIGDIASYYGIAEAVRLANPTVTYREYTDVVQDQVDIELDLASLGDRTWFDRDGDGLEDGDEPGLEGVGVIVTFLGLDDTFGTGDDETFSTTTGPDGLYLVENLPGGQYRVDVTTGDLPAGMSATYDLDDGLVAPNDRWEGLLGQAAEKDDVDFGYNGSGLIGDTVWFDRDGNGTVDGGEHGLEGVTVTVTWDGPDGIPGNGDDVPFITVTDADGDYEVDGLPPGDYTVVIDDTTVPAGMDPTYDDDGIGTPHVSTVVLGAGEQYRDSDFGYNGASEIGDFIWLDLDGGGTHGIGEPAIPDVVVQLTWPGEDGILGNGDDDVFITTTDGSGNYLFAGLPAGDYQVDVLGGLPAFVTNTFDEDLNGDSSVQVTLGASDSHLSTDFGYQGTTSVGDFVWFDVDNDGAFDAGEPGIEGAEVTLTYAGPDGVIGNSDDITLATTTDVDGAFLFTGLPEGDYVVAVTAGVPAGMTNTFDEDSDLDGHSGEFTVLNNTMHLTADFGYAGTGSLGDYVWLDRNGDGVQDGDEPGIPGVTITATWAGPDGTPGTGDDYVFSTATDIDGGYTIDDLPAGDYVVAVATGTLPSGLSATFDRDSTPDNTTSLTLGNGQDLTDVDFGYQGGASLGDTVWFDRNSDGVVDADEFGLAGVTVDLTWAGPDGIFGNADDEAFTTVTDGGGQYVFDNLPAGDYQVSVATGTLPGGMAATFDEDGGLDSTIAVNLSDGEVHESADIGYNGSGSIGDRIWIDRNADGIQDADEPGVPGQEVTLTWAGPDGVLGNGDDQVYTTLTGADGIYGFTGLPPADYTVEVTGSIATAATNTYDEDADNDSLAPVALGNGEIHDTTDFGYRGSAAIGDTVWLDLDADGFEDPSEPGIPGVDVVVTWYGPDGVPGGGDDVAYPPVTTDGAGFYQVDGLATGDYGVAIVTGVPAGLTNSADEDGDNDGQTDVTGLMAAEVYDTSDFGYAGSGAIGSTIWLDLDGDGLQGPGEPGIPEVDVTLSWAGADGVLGTGDDVAITTTTDAAGTYLFVNLPAGDFTVDVDGGDLPSGVSPTADPDGGADNASAATLPAGGSDLDQDFGYQGGSSIGDFVWHDLNRDGVADPGEPGVPGVAVTVTYHGVDGVAGTNDDIEITTTTDAAGTYRTPGIPGGTYTVVVDPATLPAGTQPNDDLDGGDPASTAVTIGDTEDKDDVDYAITGASTLQGIVETHECTTAGFPLVGVADVIVRVTWSGPAGPASVEVVTDATGNWIAPNLPPGDYTVELITSSLPAGTVPTSPGATTATLSPSGIETVNWVVDEPIDIVSRVWIDEDGDGTIGATELGIADVLMTLRNESGLAIATAFTDASGTYEFVGLLPGNYTVEIDPATVPAHLVLTVDPDGGSDMIAAAVLNACEAPTTVAAAFAFRDQADLPVTGFPLAAAFRLALLLLLLGTALLVVSSQRRLGDGRQ